MFGAIGILAALRERETTGKGKLVRSALFENTAFLVGQHMAQTAITGEEPPPMSMKRPAWGVYDIFPTSDDRLFVGIVTDTQWEVFCREFQEQELGADARLKTNTQRVNERDWLLPRLGEIFKRWTRADLEKRLEAIGLPYAPITKPSDLFNDPHLLASGGLAEIRDPRGHTFRTPTLPLELDGKRLPQRANPPAIGEGTQDILQGLGYSTAAIDALLAANTISISAPR
jgi:crotonobetainyl-CoA:carnitine CoA-transferase CaiB-like acyl-CoA transferase